MITLTHLILCALFQSLVLTIALWRPRTHPSDILKAQAKVIAAAQSEISSLYNSNMRLQRWCRAVHGPDWRVIHEEWRRSQGLPDGMEIATQEYAQSPD